METFLVLDNKKKKAIPENFKSDDNRNPENIVEYFLKMIEGVNG